ncbi:MAG: hypothetical protein ACXWZ7_15740 [Gemmatirosa sp.]
MRQLPRLLHVALLSGAALVLLAPDTAHAQLGGLRRRMEERMAKAVLGEDASKSNATPTFNGRVLEISDARVEQLVKGLRVEAAEMEKRERENKAMDAKAAAHEKAAEAYGTCSAPYTKELMSLTTKTMAFGLLAKREESKDGKVSAATTDSLNAVTARMLKLKDTMVAKCGEGPGDSPFDAMKESGEGAEGSDPESVGAKAAGLTRDQYAVLRERVAAWLQSKDGRTGQYAFAAGERATLEKRAGDLAAFRKLLVD